jgi:hypothetical protein
MAAWPRPLPAAASSSACGRSRGPSLNGVIWNRFLRQVSQEEPRLRKLSPDESFVMNESNDNRLLAARSSLVLFLIGLLVPIATIVAVLGTGKYVLINFTSRQNPNAGLDAIIYLAVGFGFLCEALALLLGIAGRRHDSGRFGMVGSIIVLAVVALPALCHLSGGFAPVLCAFVVSAAIAWLVVALLRRI